jgi:hypothetical protein
VAIAAAGASMREIDGHKADICYTELAPSKLTQPRVYKSNSATTVSVSLSGSNSPARASSTILTATSSITGVDPVSPILAQASLNARFMASTWPGLKGGGPPRRSSLNLEVPCAAHALGCLVAPANR